MPPRKRKKKSDDIFLSPLDLTQYELAQYKLKCEVQDVKLKKMELDKFRREAEEVIKNMGSKIKGSQEAVQAAEEKLKAVQEEISKKYEIDLSCITYDDETGKVLFLPDEVVENTKK